MQVWVNPTAAPFPADMAALDAFVLGVTLISHPSAEAEHAAFVSNPRFSDIPPLAGVGDEARMGLAIYPFTEGPPSPGSNIPALVGHLVFRRGTVIVDILVNAGSVDAVSSLDLVNWATLIDLRLGTGLPY